jgi:Pyridoxamine 5'-phosphate oxidase
VLARPIFERTVSYRSATIYARHCLVTDPAERLTKLRCITEHIAPGQWNRARQPSRKELAAVRLLELPREGASVKIRTGPPDDGDSPDAALGLWVGEPLAATWQQPIPEPALPPTIAAPAQHQRPCRHPGRAEYQQPARSAPLLATPADLKPARVHRAGRSWKQGSQTRPVSFPANGPRSGHHPQRAQPSGDYQILRNEDCHARIC